MEDYNHIKRILMNRCLAELAFEEPLSNKLEFISCGNSKNFIVNPKLVEHSQKHKNIKTYQKYVEAHISCSIPKIADIKFMPIHC
jgi:hypothetical protein